MGQGRDKHREEAAPDKLSPLEEACLKTAKEIAVKFIETGRISVASFGEVFGQIYRAVRETVSDRG